MKFSAEDEKVIAVIFLQVIRRYYEERTEQEKRVLDPEVQVSGAEELGQTIPRLD